MIFVTHDQEEAMSLADEIFLFRSEELEQSARPHDLYRRPRTRYVAEFFGKANLLPVTVQAALGGRELRAVGHDAVIARGAQPEPAADGKAQLCMVRPEAWRVAAAGGEPWRLGLSMDRLRELCIHPDGRQIAFTAGWPEKDVWVLEGFLPATRTARASEPQQ